jgi:hypothetical protein
MTNKEIAKRLQKFRGKYRDIAKETEVAYTTIRKLACGALPKAGDAITKPVIDWLHGRRA